MALTETAIKSLKPGLRPSKNSLGQKTVEATEKRYKVSDGKGLYLEIYPNGTKSWRIKYRFEDKERRYVIGVYPEISLAFARQRREEVRSLVAKGIDPNQHKKAMKQARQTELTNSFEVVAREWLVKRGKKSVSGDKRLVAMLEKDLFPFIGSKPICDITEQELLKVLNRIVSRGAVETSHRAKQYAGQIFRFGVVTGRCSRDVSAALKEALPTPKERHHSAITDPDQVGQLMATIYNHNATYQVKAALQLSPLFFCRPGELRQLEWTEVSFEEQRIEIPAEKMKLKRPHIIPLATQSVEILKSLHLITGKGKYVFPSPRGGSRPLSENGVRTALRTMGYTNEQMTPHGFRAMARTLLDEVLEFPVDWIEHQLSHAVKDPTGRAYNRTRHLDQRKVMMQKWADYLDELRQAFITKTIVTTSQDK